METSKGCKKLYLAPTLSLSFVEVEQGFATSETGGSGDWREDPIVPGDGSAWDCHRPQYGQSPALQSDLFINQFTLSERK